MLMTSEWLHSWLKGYHGTQAWLSRFEDNIKCQYTLYIMFHSLSQNTITLSVPEPLILEHHKTLFDYWSRYEEQN